jgi:hypothetical protein
MLKEMDPYMYNPYAYNPSSYLTYLSNFSGTEIGECDIQLVDLSDKVPGLPADFLTKFTTEFGRKPAGILFKKCGLIIPVPVESAVTAAFEKSIVDTLGRAVTDEERQLGIKNANTKTALDYYKNVIGTTSYSREKFIQALIARHLTITPSTTPATIVTAPVQAVQSTVENMADAFINLGGQ